LSALLSARSDAGLIVPGDEALWQRTAERTGDAATCSAARTPTDGR
jgi:hypothetical protein